MSDPNPLDLLKEEMESDEVFLRVNAIHRLKIVSTIMGPDGIQTQLLPYIDTLIKKEEDEVLFAIAQELETLAPCLPGSQTVLLPYLEALASQEETVVRDMAVKSLISVSNSLGDYQIVNYYIPMILRLANNDTNFTCRVSAVNLICPIYQRSGQHKQKLRQKFSELCGEETPMVRRAVAIKIGNFATVVEKEHVLNEFILNIKQLIQDDQDQVRVLGLDSLKQVAKILSKEENQTHTLPIIIGATQDQSWRVRLELSRIFADLAEAFGKEVADVSLIQIFTNLLRDAENDVRTAAIYSLAKFVQIVSPEKLQIIVPHLQYLARDSVWQVRSGVTEVIATMASLLPKDIATQKLLLHIQEMFADENKQVRQGVCRAAAKFVEAVGPDSINTFIPYFKKAIEDDQWRVRLEAYESLVELAQHYHNPDIFTKHIEPLYMNFLKDRVSSVREGGVEKLQILIATYKTDWIFSRLLPKLNETLGKDNSYLFRMTALQAMKVIALNSAPEIVNDQILSVLYQNINDSVPNIRFSIIQILKQLSTKVSESTLQEMKQYIEPLQKDTDKDVKIYALEFFGISN